MLNSCVMHRHTGPASGIMVWGGIRYHSRTPLVHINGTLNSQRYIFEVLEPVVLAYLQGLVTVIFQQDNALPHVACMFLSASEVILAIAASILCLSLEGDLVEEDWWCRAGRGNEVKTRRVEQAVVSRPLPKNYSSRSYESSLDGAASECIKRRGRHMSWHHPLQPHRTNGRTSKDLMCNSPTVSVAPGLEPRHSSHEFIMITTRLPQGYSHHLKG
ncbi:transposable element Tcb1 transposase [Trichonephila clavipes]|nr:transposable element Tcb1 transposase [Trichonephila clavipes]